MYRLIFCKWRHDSIRQWDSRGSGIWIRMKTRSRDTSSRRNFRNHRRCVFRISISYIRIANVPRKVFLMTPARYYPPPPFFLRERESHANDCPDIPLVVHSYLQLERLRKFAVLHDLVHRSPAIICEVRLDDLERISCIPRLPMGFAPGRSNNAP